jgi:hypothetical protein
MKNLAMHKSSPVKGDCDPSRQTPNSEPNPADFPKPSSDLSTGKAQTTLPIVGQSGQPSRITIPSVDPLQCATGATANIKNVMASKTATKGAESNSLATIHDIPVHAFNVCGHDTRQLLEVLSVETQPTGDRLSAEEKRQQEDLELQISAHAKADFERKLAFLIIRERKLYREAFGTFAQYCERRWAIGRQQGHRHASDAEVLLQLGAAGFGHELPPAKALPKIHTIPARHRPQFWKWFLSNHTDAKRTMRQIAEACAIYRRNLGIQSPSLARLTDKQDTQRGILHDCLRQQLPKGVSNEIQQVLPRVPVSVVLRRAVRWSFNEVMRGRSDKKRKTAPSLTLKEMLEMAPDPKTRSLMENYAAEALRNQAIKGTALYVAKTRKTHKKKRVTKTGP